MLIFGKKASWTLFFQNILTNPMISEISFLWRHTYKNNFFTRTVKEWNTLPSFLLDQPSVDEFKSAVTNYFNLPRWFYYSFIFCTFTVMETFGYYNTEINKLKKKQQRKKNGLTLLWLDTQPDFKIANYFGGARSKGFATLRNVSKLPFFVKINWARKVCRFSVLFGYLTRWEPN